MRKKYILCIFSLLSFFLLMSNVSAAEDTTCNYDSRAYLNKLASNVKASYDFKYESDGSVSFDISIFNIVEDLYVAYRADSGSEEKVFASMTSDGTYTFNVKDTDNIVTYTFIVRSMKFGCSHDIRTFTLTKPRKNPYSDMDICKYEELEDYFYCQKWVTQKIEGTESEIIAKIKAKRKGIKKTTTTRCIECEKEEKEKELKNTYMKRRTLLIGSISAGILIDLIAIVVMIIRIRRYSI